ncbi:MAG: histidine phosphatase family protein [Chitinophagaceae bacterium]
MKSIILVRHAKSSWDDITVKDFDRPLNDRGKRDAPVMARRLLDKKIVIDAFITSTAKRARKTATIFAEEFKVDKDQLILVPELYLPAPEAFLKAIQNAPAAADTIALFSHNPGITEFANSLTTVRVDDMPTCAMYGIKLDIDSWHNFGVAGKTFWFFDYPKAV